MYFTALLEAAHRMIENHVYYVTFAGPAIRNHVFYDIFANPAAPTAFLPRRNAPSSQKCRKTGAERPGRWSHELPRQNAPNSQKRPKTGAKRPGRRGRRADSVFTSTKRTILAPKAKNGQKQGQNAPAAAATAACAAASVLLRRNAQKRVLYKKIHVKKCTHSRTQSDPRNRTKMAEFWQKSCVRNKSPPPWQVGGQVAGGVGGWWWLVAGW